MADKRGVVVAIDAGTSSVRALAFDADGHIVDTAARALVASYPASGWVEQNPALIWDLTVATLVELSRRLRAATRTIAALGITNQRETSLAWSRLTGKVLHPAIVWQDRRTAQRCEELRLAGEEPEVRRLTGLVLDPYFSATKFEWMLGAAPPHKRATHQDAPHIDGNTEGLALATVDSWIIWNLTGGTNKGVFVTDTTNSSRTLLASLATPAWSDHLCEMFSVPKGALAEIVPSAGRVGTVSATVFGADSALAGVPISGIAGDQQAALFGHTCFEPEMAKVTYGTGSFVLVNAGAAVPEPPHGLVATVAWDLGAHGGSTYALEGSTFVSGAAIQWLRDELGIIERAEDLGPLAASVADSGGITFVPAFTGLGSPWWDPDARGTVTGITKGSGKAQFARAVVDAIAFQVDDMLGAMREAGRPCAALRADGGAAAMDVLLQRQADLSDVPVTRPAALELTARGAATLAGLAEGFFGSLDELVAMQREATTFTPHHIGEVANVERATWLRAVDRARDWSNR